MVSAYPFAFGCSNCQSDYAYPPHRHAEVRSWIMVVTSHLQSYTIISTKQ
nr:MAG TPA: hypothetical protein [Caudoviricetes sp.]DAN82209.1 MAG TPA: hypothetical protein [Caudoviricetes sp.]